jgi:hypothetical protein
MASFAPRPALTSFAPTHAAEPKKARLFHHMATMPLPYLIILPAIFVVLIGVGWTRDSYIEEEVAKIWIPTVRSACTCIWWMILDAFNV